MGEIFCFEIDENKTFQDVVVKHEVDIEMPTFDIEMFLAGDKGEASAEFEQELLQMIDKSLLKIVFIEMLVLQQIEEFQHVGIFDDLFILNAIFSNYFIFSQVLTLQTTFTALHIYSSIF